MEMRDPIKTICMTAFGPVVVPDWLDGTGFLFELHYEQIEQWAEDAYKRGLRLKEVKRFL